MKGLVLAGGSGKRLRPLTYSGAKQLVPVANRPVLFFVIDNLVGAGVRDIGVVVSPETGDEVRAALGDGSRWAARFTFVLQPKPAGLADAVRVARPFLGDDDFCMFLGDNLIGTSIAEAVARFVATPSCAASVLLKEVDDPSRFGVAEVDEAGHVTRLVEKPAEPRSRLALVGVYLLRRSIFDAIDRTSPSARGELEITDALGALLGAGLPVRFDRLEAWWLDTGKMDDLLTANDTVLDAWLDPAVLGAVDAESRISGRVRVEEGAEIVRSHVVGPAVVGAGARVIDARVGPNVSIGAEATVERSAIVRSVLLEGAIVRDVPRLVDSLLGRRVVVERGRPADELTLLVGDDCRIGVGR